MIEWNLMAAFVTACVFLGLLVVFFAGWREDRKSLSQWQFAQRRERDLLNLLNDASMVIEWYTAGQYNATSTRTGTAQSFAYYELAQDILRRHRVLRDHEPEEIA